LPKYWNVLKKSVKTKERTDVIVILVGIFHRLREVYPDTQLWVAFGKGMHFRHYHINSICDNNICPGESLKLFHSSMLSVSVWWKGKEISMEGLESLSSSYRRVLLL